MFTATVYRRLVTAYLIYMHNYAYVIVNGIVMVSEASYCCNSNMGLSYSSMLTKTTVIVILT